MKLLSAVFVLNAFNLYATAEPVFWRDPGPVQSLDMIRGPGGGKTPQTPFTFIEEDKSGTSAKIIVQDANRTKWIVKFGEEAKPETFASRIVWAAGYYAEPTYFIPQGQIQGSRDLTRAKAFIQGGQFQNARFERMDDGPRDKRWKLDDSKFKGSKELAGLKVLIMLLSNWDAKPENFAIVESEGQAMYAITDWGASMGHPAELMDRSKWDCVRYKKDSDSFIEGVDNGFVVFNHQGKRGEEVRHNIKVDDVQWLMRRLGKLSEAQINTALKASGATAEETACFSEAFRTRLRALMGVGSATSEEGTVTRTRREVKTVQKPQ